jgi:hypothetical protein
MSEWRELNQGFPGWLKEDALSHRHQCAVGEGFSLTFFVIKN